MLKDDEIRLRHMLDAAREAVSFARGRVRGDLESTASWSCRWSKTSRLLVKQQPR